MKAWLNNNPQATQDPAQVKRRRFLELWVKKLSRKWRELIIQHDAHRLGKLDNAPPESVNFNFHSPLSAVDKFRLTRLLPSFESHASIQCELSEETLGSGVQYKALSYVWGSSSTRRSIQLNGEDLLPRHRKSRAALRQLRPQSQPPRTLWIDAICIDQHSIHERNEQVR
jgi:hypothetical protein